MTLFRGNWQRHGSTIRQTNDRDAARAHFGDPKWQDYTLTLKARKLAGRDGLGVIVRNSDGGSYLQWNLGSRGNKQHQLEAHLASHSVDDTTVARADGSLETNRWYDLKVELEGSHVRCYLDGQMVHDVEIPPPSLPRLFATASRDDARGQIILKVVNPTEDPTEVDLNLRGVSGLASQAHAVVLKGNPDDVNSIEEPGRIVPVDETVDVAQPRFRHTFAPNSLTVLRFDTGAGASSN